MKLTPRSIGQTVRYTYDGGSGTARIAAYRAFWKGRYAHLEEVTGPLAGPGIVRCHEDNLEPVQTPVEHLREAAARVCEEVASGPLMAAELIRLIPIGGLDI